MLRPWLFAASWSGVCPICGTRWLPGHLIGYSTNPYDTDDQLVCYSCCYAAFDFEQERRFLESE